MSFCFLYRSSTDRSSSPLASKMPTFGRRSLAKSCRNTALRTSGPSEKKKRRFFDCSIFPGEMLRDHLFPASLSLNFYPVLILRTLHRHVLCIFLFSCQGIGKPVVNIEMRCSQSDGEFAKCLVTIKQRRIPTPGKWRLLSGQRYLVLFLAQTHVLKHATGAFLVN